jgi:hypothetical protein
MAGANIAIETKNVFGLGESFGLQTARVTTSQTMPVAFGNTGAAVVSAGLEGQTNYTQDANYCGTDLRAGLGALATAFGDVATESPELVTNGDFKDGTTAWNLIVSGTAAATFAVVDGALVTTPTAVGEYPYNISPQTGYVIPLVAGTEYTVHADMACGLYEIPFAKDVRFLVYDGTNFALYYTQSITDDLLTYSYTFTPTVSGNYQIRVQGGNSLTPWTIDNIKCQANSAISTPVAGKQVQVTSLRTDP